MLVANPGVPMERLTAEDQLMLWPDEIWPQDIGALAVLDGSSLFDRGGRFRIEAVRDAVAARLHMVPGSGSSSTYRRDAPRYRHGMAAAWPAMRELLAERPHPQPASITSSAWSAVSRSLGAASIWSRRSRIRTARP